MMVGLKLLSEIVLEDRTREPFSGFRPGITPDAAQPVSGAGGEVG